MPSRPSDRVSSVSPTRRVVGPSTGRRRVQAGSSSTCGTRPARWRRHCAASSRLKARGPPPRPSTALRHPARLGTHRDRGGPARLGHEQHRVTAGDVAERPELVPGDEHEAGRDPPALQVLQHPAHRVGLVGQPDLDVLGVAGDPGVRQPGVGGGGAGQGHHLGQPAQPGVGQPLSDGADQSGDPGLRRVGPARLRDQVDLAPVEASDHGGVQAEAGQPLDDRGGGPVERGVLLGRGHPLVHQLRPGRADPVDLRAAVEAQVQPSRALRTGGQLPVDVAEVGAADDGDLDGVAAQLLDQPPDPSRVGPTVRHRGAVPVEDDGRKGPVQRARRAPSSSVMAGRPR